MDTPKGLKKVEGVSGHCTPIPFLCGEQIWHGDGVAIVGGLAVRSSCLTSQYLAVTNGVKGEQVIVIRAEEWNKSIWHVQADDN